MPGDGQELRVHNVGVQVLDDGVVMETLEPVTVDVSIRRFVGSGMAGCRTACNSAQLVAAQIAASAARQEVASVVARQVTALATLPLHESVGSSTAGSSARSAATTARAAFTEALAGPPSHRLANGSIPGLPTGLISSSDAPASGAASVRSHAESVATGRPGVFACKQQGPELVPTAGSGNLEARLQQALAAKQVSESVVCILHRCT
jgi:hypothetical protein